MMIYCQKQLIFYLTKKIRNKYVNDTVYFEIFLIKIIKAYKEITLILYENNNYKDIFKLF